MTEVFVEQARKHWAVKDILIKILIDTNQRYNLLPHIFHILGKVPTSVPVSAYLSMGMSAMIRADSLNLFAGFE